MFTIILFSLDNKTIIDFLTTLIANNDILGIFSGKKLSHLIQPFVAFAFLKTFPRRLPLLKCLQEAGQLPRLTVTGLNRVPGLI